MTSWKSSVAEPALTLIREFVGGASELTIGGVSAASIADTFKTPAYVYDAEILRRNLLSVTDALGDRVEVLFALKANPNAALARVFRLAGAGCEVASAGEIHVATHAGFTGNQIQFAGPGKTALDLETALEHRIGAINLESEGEYDYLEALSSRLGQRPGVAIRVNPSEALCSARMHMGGASKRFGVDAECVPGLVRKISDRSACELRGLHLYTGTQSFDARSWVASARYLCDFANRLESEQGVQLHTLNFGGGLGVALFAGDTPINMDQLGSGIRLLVHGDAHPERRYFVELGRYLAANAGVYLTRVLYRKHSRGRQHLVLDGGMHHHSAAAGVGAIIRRTFPIVLARSPLAPPTNRYTLGGPLCTTADEFVADLELPNVEPGDLIAILGSGAYGLTFSNTRFLSHPLPCEILVDRGSAMLVRDRGSPTDALVGQRLPS